MRKVSPKTLPGSCDHLSLIMWVKIDCSGVFVTVFIRKTTKPKKQPAYFKKSNFAAKYTCWRVKAEHLHLSSMPPEDTMFDFAPYINTSICRPVKCF